MDSPESSKPAPSPAATPSPTVVQDSPFLAYVSNLSPIKPLNDVHAPSAFRELNFPSPSPVFTSPHANPNRKENLLKRAHCPSPDSGKLCLEYSGSTKELSENAYHFGSNASLPMIGSLSCSMKDSECEFPIYFQSCSSPSGCVDEFLADPMEDCVDSSGPPDLCSDQAAQLHQQSQDRFAILDETSKECSQQQDYCPPFPVCDNEIQPNQGQCVKATDSPEFLICDQTHDADIGSNIGKEIIADLNPHVENMKEGGVKSEERTVEDLLLDKTKISVDGSDEDYTNNNTSLSHCSGLLFHSANDLMENDKREEFIGDMSGYIKSVDQDTHGESSVMPKSDEGDVLNQRKEKYPYPEDHTRYAKQQSAETVKGVKLDCTPKMHAESEKIVSLYNSLYDNSGASCNTSAGNVISYERGGFPSKMQSGYQHQRVMRKRLEFDSAGASKMDPEVHVFKSASYAGCALSRSSPYLNQKVRAQMNMADRSTQNNSSVMTAPRPSGIGLHLNSIVNVVVMNCHLNMQSEKDLEKDNLGAGEEMTLCCSTHEETNHSKVWLASVTSTGKVYESGAELYSLVHSVSANSDGSQQENCKMGQPSSSVSLESGVNVNPLKSSLQPRFIDCSIVPCNTNGPPPEDACASEELNEMSPRRTRRKVSDDAGCKRCNCKKSKCLKLYCDCFAAGIYCAEACACQGCSNRPEYKDTVLGTRQQIENRNPLAFAPKVVVRVAETLKDSDEENKCINPPSARHKRGCNCKKSRCLKKYCECFQAKVGCSVGCRCEGCKNSFGRKEGVKIVETEHMRAMDEGCQDYLPDGAEVDVQNGNKHLRCHSPFTPLQEDSNGGNVSKCQHAARSRFSSPDSAAAALFSHAKSQSSPTNSGHTTRLMKVKKRNLLQHISHQELEIHDGDEIDQFSPSWDRLAERCNLRLLPSASPSDVGDKTNSLRARFSQGSGRLSVGSLLWHSSPVTPISQFGESRLSVEPCSNSEPPNAYEDDTPDILKDTYGPDEGLKMSSPNKKRVSPPHKVCVNEMTSSSSSSMRSRKFILKSVPSFPSLSNSNNIIGHGT